MLTLQPHTKSPNFNNRPPKTAIDTIVLHYTGMKNAQVALERLCNEEDQVSAHYVVDEVGKIYSLVDESKRAYHAGISSWRGRQNVNDFSIGIEIVNLGHELGYQKFPQIQMEAVLELCLDIVARNNKIEKRNIVGHSDIAPSRKLDPGELFDWRYLANNDVGIFPTIKDNHHIEAIAEIGSSNDVVRKIQQDLAQFGYTIKVDNYFGVQMSYVVEAFQRHFTPYRLDGVWDKNAQNMLTALLSRS